VTAGGLLIVAALVGTALAAILAAACCWIVGRDYLGLRVRTLDTLVAGLRRGIVAIVGTILTTVAIVVVVVLGFLAMTVMAGGSSSSYGGPGAFLAIVVAVSTAVVAVFIGVRLAMVLPVISLERTGPIHALRRSWHLTGGNAWRTFGVLLLAGILFGLLSLLISLLATMLVLEPIESAGGPAGVADVIAQSAITILFASPGPVVVGVLYHDLLVRREDWDVPASGTPAASLDP
jgi:hypothetical protein